MPGVENLSAAQIKRWCTFELEIDLPQNCTLARVLGLFIFLILLWKPWLICIVNFQEDPSADWLTTPSSFKKRVGLMLIVKLAQ